MFCYKAVFFIVASLIVKCHWSNTGRYRWVSARRYSSAWAMGLRLFCTNTLIYGWNRPSTWPQQNTWECRHNERDGVSNHQRLHCLLNRLFRSRSKKTSKMLVTGLCDGNHQWAVDSPHEGPVTRKMLPFDDVIMTKYETVSICQGACRMCHSARLIIIKIRNSQ